MELHEAKFYEKNRDLSVTCTLCPHKCNIKPGDCGKCLARKNREGTLFAENYGKITTMELDSIEKKPLFLFRPGCDILSVGSWGCNLKCAYCSTHSISQHMAKSKYISPKRLVSIARDNITEGNVGICFTYNEPLVSFEYIYDCAYLASKVGLKVVVVTNGFINPEPLRELLPFVDAMNIDLKAFTDSFYFNVCGGDIEPIKNAIKVSAEKCHVEVSTVVIPGLNDSDEEIKSLSEFLGSVSKEIPLHLIRHNPDYRLFDRDSIEKKGLVRLANIASKSLRNVFLGNLE